MGQVMSELCTTQKIQMTLDLTEVAEHEMVAFPLHKLPVSCCCTGDYRFVKVTRGSCIGETIQRSEDGCKNEITKHCYNHM